MADQVRSRLEDVAADVRRTLSAALAQESGAAATTQAALVDARSAIESRLAVLEDELDTMSERIESLARDGASTTTSKVDGVAAGVAALGQKLDAQLDRIVAQLREANEERIREVSLEMEAQHEQLRSELAKVRDTALAETTTMREAIAELTETVKAGLQSFSGSIDTGLTSMAGLVATTLEDSRDKTRDETRGELDKVAEKLYITLGALGEHFGGRDDAQAAQLAALQSAVERRVEAVRAHDASALDEM
jgi:hypothetical protein